MYLINSQRFFFFSLVLFSLLFANLSLRSQSCLTNTLIINTGYNPATGASLPLFVNDPYWTVISDPLPDTFEPRPASTINKHPNWDGPFPNSQWIAVYNSYANSTNGIYEYERCFCIEATGRFRISLQIYADDTVAVFLGSSYLGGSTPAGFGAQFTKPLQIDTIITLNQGRQCLRFVVGNIGSVAHGLNVSGNIISLTPAPAILADSCCLHPGFIIGQKFNDLNCNGTLDNGEPILSNWPIVVQGVQGINFVDTAYTGSDGYYSIAISPGCYNVFEIQQAGWTQTSPSGIQQICINSGEVITLNFLNCNQPPCDTIGEIHLDSSCCQFNIPVFNLGQNPLTQIQWQILNNSGTMESINIMSSCSFNLVPPNPYGTTSGVINFTGNGCTTNPTLIMEANPSTASGIVTIAFAFVHKGQVCYDTVSLHCARAPLIKCDSLVVSPFTWPGLNLSGRTFKIFNQKQPTSAIKEVKIKLTPDPFPSDPNAKWNGGGLIVDGNSRSWGIANSGNPYYSLINMDCDPQTPPSAPQGNASNSTVQFNLGVDYTLNWTGNVILTIIHCDGDTCELVYNNWCAKPPKQCISLGSGISIDTSKLPTIIVAASAKFSLKNRSNVRYISIELAEKETNTQIIDGFAGIVDSNNNIIASGKRIEQIDGEDMVITSAKSTVIELPKVFDGRKNDCQIIAFFVGDSVVKFNVILYDDNVNPIGFETFEASQPISSVKTSENEYQNLEFMKIIPNPTKNSATIEFFNPIEGNVSLQIIDLLGNEIRTIETGWKSFGVHQTTANLNGLPSGSYIVVLKFSNGKVIPKPLLITN